MSSVRKKEQMKMFILCWISYANIYFGRMNLSVAQKLMQSDLGLSNTAIGGFSSLFFCVYACGKLVNGYLGDKGNNKWLIFQGLLISGLCNILFGIVHNYYVLLALWGLNGFFQSLMWCNILKIICSWYPPKQISKVMIDLSTSMVAGTFLGLSGCGLLAAFLPWKYQFLIPGGILVFNAAVWAGLAQNGPVCPQADGCVGREIASEEENMGAMNGERTGYVPAIGIIKFLFTSGLILVTLVCLPQGIVKDNVGVWGPTMVTDIYHFNVSQSSMILLAIPVLNFLGILVVGRLKEAGGLSTIRISICTLGISLLLILLLVFGMEASPVIGIGALGLLSAVMYGQNALLLGAIPTQYAAYGRVSFASGFLDCFSYIATAGFSALTGIMLDQKLGWQYIFLTWIGMILLSIAALIRCKKKMYL